MMRHAALAVALSVFTMIGSPALAVEEHWSPVVDSIEEQHRTYQVAAAAHADGLIHVSLTNHDGSALFESVYPIVDEDGVKRLQWTYRYADGTEMSRVNALPVEVVPSIRSMVSAGKDIARMLGAGLQPGSHNLRPGKVKTNDTWGCDLPEFVDIECTSRGNCCDTHDACYAVGNCSAWSWTGAQTLWCEACNATVVLCAATGLGSTGAPSVCCNMGNCGQERIAVSGPNKDLIPGMEPTNEDGSAAWGYDNPWVVYTSGGMCTFPDGSVVPCA
jgi:hypothetical protein